MNVAYAWLAEQADADDRVAVPAYIAAGAKQRDVEAGMRRLALDEWLSDSAPTNVTTLRDFYGVAS